MERWENQRWAPLLGWGATGSLPWTDAATDLECAPPPRGWGVLVSAETDAVGWQYGSTFRAIAGGSRPLGRSSARTKDIARRRRWCCAADRVGAVDEETW